MYCAEYGCTVTRSFCFWPDFMPEPWRLDELVADRLEDFLDAHVEAGLTTIPTFLVGHMSGENWDPAWRGGRDLYRDVWMVSQQAWLAAELPRLFGQHPAISGWLVSNEMPLYGGPADEEEITAWARLLIQAVRSAGAKQPISLGDGAWGIEVSGLDNGYSLRALAPLVDFIGPHVYPMEDDETRQHLSAAFATQLAGGFGRPVVLEEFGVSSDFASDEHAADYYRLVLHTTLLAGARGWIAWNNCDYDDLRREDPYRHHVFENHFGLTDRHGRPKEQLRRSPGSPISPGRSRAPVGSGSQATRRSSCPSTSNGPSLHRPGPRRDIRDNLFQSYIAAREADSPVGRHQLDGIPATARLYLVPSAKVLTGPGLERLPDLARGGATVYLSYFAGSTPNQRGPWLAWLDELFGVRHTLRYGLVDPIVGHEVTYRFLAPFGEIEPGACLSFLVAGTPSARAFLPVEPEGAEFVAVDDHDRPALLRHRIGSGCAVLSTYPTEHMAARAAARTRRAPGASTRPLRRLQACSSRWRPVIPG